MSPAASTVTLAPVSLDELVSEAALLKRIDRKYLVPADIAAAALDDLDPRSRVLEIEGQRAFAYDSVYFDTEDHLSYRLTAQRRRRRFKLRTRSYIDTGGCYLELKTKSGRGATVKERIPYEACDRARLTLRGVKFCRSVLEAHGHGEEVIAQLQPALGSSYRRTTVLLPEGSRATFDTHLGWRGGARGLTLPGHAIIETKSQGGVSALDQWLWRRGHRPSGISKFGTGTAALHPELPHNKWARVLRGPFEVAKELS